MGKIIGIVAVDDNWGIGKKNDLLFKLKEDMKFFRETTKDGIVAMGYNTLLSLPGSKPLKGRVNLVLAPAEVERDDCIVVHSFDEMVCMIAKYAQKDDRDVYIVGGAMFYQSMLPYYDKVYVTRVYADGQAEVFFPNLDKIKEFSVSKRSELIKDGDYNIRFLEYSR